MTKLRFLVGMIGAIAASCQDSIEYYVPGNVRGICAVAYPRDARADGYTVTLTTSGIATTPVRPPQSYSIEFFLVDDDGERMRRLDTSGDPSELQVFGIQAHAYGEYGCHVFIVGRPDHRQEYELERTRQISRALEMARRGG